ncbi:cysteine protease ATG4B isoform X2 [Dendrobium catenatum]|uniref:Cysteine protease n=3 Tax=Dendrobium catenatum TaxID=906689 RepID=A0A2I0W0W5_9ASPA|nr:cysteine protease ATG4B isoform X2 [Dendrobium catenatum]XP_020703961.1 cysteine protease ATG4B isoform X2 [Dendrobium catenatum]XP_020703962.1 cysteine protease ATG4B isoform X2 [Dendrobium catenatum]PKU69304.1 Cysteine protease ATG4A [Dendrobium catenatum]
MTSLPERAVNSNFPAGQSSDPVDTQAVGSKTEQAASHNRSPKASLLLTLFSSTFPIFETLSNPSSADKKEIKPRNYGLTTAVKRVMTGGMMRRLQEHFLGTSKADFSSLTNEMWLLGSFYKVSSGESSTDINTNSGLAAFLEDFSSKIWITYRKGFDAIGDSRFTSDVNWGCMIRSSQMLVAQALVFHHLGRSWRKPQQKPYDREYVGILYLFGDSEACPYSIHNLIQAGMGYGLSAGSWVGPYAMCRTWETLVRANRDNGDHSQGRTTLPMVLYIVSGDEDGERGGAPVVCLDVASRLSSECIIGHSNGAPLLLLVPLVLGLEKINPRYIPLLRETFTFPQSLGIMGGKPGASTYIVGVQDDKAFYLDPHEVQPVVDIKANNLEADTSSYHCSTVRNMPLDSIDPSLAIGFYCRDKDDFIDFCCRASVLAERSNGAPLFTVAKSFENIKSKHNIGSLSGRLGDIAAKNSSREENNSALEKLCEYDGEDGEDDWQVL